jgi:hypothetical protein
MPLLIRACSSLPPQSSKKNPPLSMMGKVMPASSAADVTAGKMRVEGWTRSKYNDTDLRKLRMAGLLSLETKTKAAGDETVLQPKKGWQVIFVSFLIRG